MPVIQNREVRKESEFLAIRDHVIYSYIPDPDYMLFDIDMIEEIKKNKQMFDDGESFAMYQPIAVCQGYPLVKSELGHRLKDAESEYGAQQVYFDFEELNLKVIQFD